MPLFRASLSLLSEASRLNLKTSTRFPLPISIGTDICSVHRIARFLNQPARAERFVKRILSPQDALYHQTLNAIKQWADAAAKAQKQDDKKAQQQYLEIPDGEEVSADEAEAGLQQGSESTESQKSSQSENPDQARPGDLKWRNKTRFAQFMAGRFAAKEAVIKAHPHRRLTWHEIVIGRTSPPISSAPKDELTDPDAEEPSTPSSEAKESKTDPAIQGKEEEQSVTTELAASGTEGQDAEPPTQSASQDAEEDQSGKETGGEDSDKSDKFLDYRSREHSNLPVFATVRGWYKTGPLQGKLAVEQQARLSISHDVLWATATCIGHFDDGRLSRIMDVSSEHNRKIHGQFEGILKGDKPSTSVRRVIPRMSLAPSRGYVIRRHEL